MADFRTSPRYQRAIQRLRRMSPEQRAIVSTISLDESFAGGEMRQKLQSMEAAADKEARATSLELGEKKLGLKTREFRFAKKQLPIATAVGVGQVGASTYLGLKEIEAAEGLAARRRLTATRYGSY